MRGPYHDKVGHFVLMGILAFLAIVSLAPRMKGDSKKAVFKITVILLLIIALEETSQYFIPSRTFSLTDFPMWRCGSPSSDGLRIEGDFTSVEQKHPTSESKPRCSSTDVWAEQPQQSTTRFQSLNSKRVIQIVATRGLEARLV